MFDCYKECPFVEQYGTTPYARDCFNCKDKQLQDAEKQIEHMKYIVLGYMAIDGVCPGYFRLPDWSDTDKCPEEMENPTQEDWNKNCEACWNEVFECPKT